MVLRTVRDVVLVFAWGFVMHAVGLLLHELGGHGLASTVLACGVAKVDLTFFGHGLVHYAPCERWTQTTILVADWAGLALTIAAGLACGAFVRRRSLPALARLALALVAFFFLVGQLGYVTSGAFHDLYDPARTSILLAEHGLHPALWLSALVAYAVAAFVFARAAIGAFREHVGSRTRLHGLAQLAATFGAAGALYYCAYAAERHLRDDMKMKGVAAEATRVAAGRGGPPPFPIELVLLSVALVAVLAALVRPIGTVTAPAPLPRSAVAAVAATALVCFAILAAFIL